MHRAFAKKILLTNPVFMNKLREDRKRHGTKRVQSKSFSERDSHRLEAVLEEALESAFGS